MAATMCIGAADQSTYDNILSSSFPAGLISATINFHAIRDTCGLARISFIFLQHTSLFRPSFLGVLRNTLARYTCIFSFLFVGLLLHVGRLLAAAAFV